MSKFNIDDTVRVIVDQNITDVHIPYDHFDNHFTDEPVIGTIVAISDFVYDKAGDAVIYEVWIDDDMYDVAEYMMEKV